MDRYKEWPDWGSFTFDGFKPLPSTQFKIDTSSPEFADNLKRPEYKLWPVGLKDVSVKVEGAVVHGFGRGSKQLGVPTANIEMTKDNLRLLEDVVPGIYMAHCLLKGQRYKSAVSIGWNPVYDNAEKTMEAHLIGSFNEDFYGERLSVELRKYIRPEALYSDFDSLIIAISSDIQATVETDF